MVALGTGGEAGGVGALNAGAGDLGGVGTPGFWAQPWLFAAV